MTGQVLALPGSHCTFSLFFIADNSFQNDECLVVSVDSTNTLAPDRFQIVPVRNKFQLEKMGQIDTQEGGTKNVAIASTSTFEAIAILSRDGRLKIRPDGKRLAGLSKDKNRNVQSAPEAVTLSFSDIGPKLLLLDNHVSHPFDKINDRAFWSCIISIQGH